MTNGEPISDAELAELLSEVAELEPLLGPDVHLTWFEIITGAAFRWFADRPVDASVIEVGLGGRWDATNVANGIVAVITNIGLDHTEFLGPTLADVAAEKAGIIKPGSTLVLSETRPELVEIFAAEKPERIWMRGRDFDVEANDLALNGRMLTLRTPGAVYEDVFLALHGRHQADNFMDALVAAEAFFDAPLEEELVAEAAAKIRSPGRLEVVGRHPLILLDGAKNVPGAQSAAAAINEEFGDARSRVLVVGMLRGKDPDDMLRALDAGQGPPGHLPAPRPRRGPWRRTRWPLPPPASAAPTEITSSVGEAVAAARRGSRTRRPDPRHRVAVRRGRGPRRPRRRGPADGRLSPAGGSHGSPLPSDLRGPHLGDLQTRRCRAGARRRDHQPPRTQRPDA